MPYQCCQWQSRSSDKTAIKTLNLRVQQNILHLFIHFHTRVFPLEGCGGNRLRRSWNRIPHDFQKAMIAPWMYPARVASPIIPGHSGNGHATESSQQGLPLFGDDVAVKSRFSDFDSYALCGEVSPPKCSAKFPSLPLVLENWDSTLSVITQHSWRRWGSQQRPI